ncbi:MAG: cation-translocating P-type ATPase [Lachnospiraceae bacterium]|nr:cation-translocating P-type ATPase [Lachnospiraceae bacterium]
MDKTNMPKGSPEMGLAHYQVVELQKEYGENRLKGNREKSVAALFWEQLNDPLIYILMAAIAISLFLKEGSDAVIIAVVILLNATVGVIQEGKARKAIDALQKLTAPKALVKRDGVKVEISGTELVPGDYVYLEAGRAVPADIRLLTATNLQVQEAALTGESVPVAKSAAIHAGRTADRAGISGVQGSGTETDSVPAGSNLLERSDFVFMTTLVTTGKGAGVVVATGMNTQIGKIADMIEQGEGELTPLQKRLAELGKLLSIVAVLVCGLLFMIALLQKRDVGDMLLTAISLAVAAVPEGLPAIVTIVLALSVSRMVKVGAIVRKLPSVETLGAVNVICSDKTGTLTQNKMTVKKVYLDGVLEDAAEADIGKVHPLLLACVLCNDATLGESRLGDPTELALLDFVGQRGVIKETLQNSYPRVNEIAFDSTRKRMTTIHRLAKGIAEGPVSETDTVSGSEKREIAFCKGAADGLLDRCDKILYGGRELSFTEMRKAEVRKAISQMAGEALRVLAFAYKKKGELTSEEEMVFAGMTGMIDPPRPEAKAAVESFRAAHVDTVMITGDHGDTAFAIASQLGITDKKEACLTGAQIDQMSRTDFLEAVDDVRVYARVTPEHKVMIVDALKQKGKIVAMTGDGINDAPSLKIADVGIAMGEGGTDVARNAADLVLTDDNFATIEKAMREGRGIFENIRKTILFLLSSNFGEIITMLVAVIAGFPSPLKAAHILWVNLITDSLPALALGVDKNDGDALMKEPPRKSKDSLFAHGGLACMICYGAVIGAISLLAYLTVPYRELLDMHLPVTVGNLIQMLERGEVLSKAQTHAFTVLGMSQLFHAVGMRDVNKSVFGMKHLENPAMLGALGIGVFLQVLVTEIPYFVELFGTSRLTMEEWGMLGILASVPLLVHEILIVSDFLVKGENREESIGSKKVVEGLREDGEVSA